MTETDTRQTTKTAKIEIKTTNSEETLTYYAVRVCDSLEGPAIFSRWQDCVLYVDKEEYEGEVQYERFQSAQKAIEYAFGANKKEGGTKSPKCNKNSNKTSSTKALDLNVNSKISKIVAATSLNEARNTAMNTMGWGKSCPVSALNMPAFASSLPIPLSLPMVTAMGNNVTPPIGLLDIAPRPVGTGVLDNKVLHAAESVIRKRTMPEGKTAEQYPKKKIRTPVLSKRAENWEKKFEMLAEYKRKHGHCNIPRDFDEYKSLYTWVKHERAKIKSIQYEEDASTIDSQTENQVRRLLDLGLDVVGNPKSVGKRVVKWQRNFDLLVEYKKDHGTCDTQKTTAENLTDEEKVKRKRLKNWIRATSDQLTLYEKNPESSTLDAERVQQLKDIHFIKHVKQEGNKLPARGGKSWEEMFEELVVFKEKHGNTNVPHLPRSTLRNWVVLQRDMYVRLKEGRKSDLNGDRVAKLVQLGFVLQPTSRLTFDERALEWLEFKTKHGREPVREREESLGAWVAKMRRKYTLLQEGQKTNLTQEQADKLTAWGFKWKTGFKKPTVITPRKTWEERFAELCAYKQENGHVNVPQLYPQLGNWVHRQRKEYRARKLGLKNGMNDEKLAKLKDVGFVFLTRKSPRSSRSEPVKSEGDLGNEEYSASEEDGEDNGYNEHCHLDQNHETFQPHYEQDPESKVPYVARKQSGIVCNWL